MRTAARADGGGRSGLSALIGVHALHAAGDALVAVALAGTLFFSVPIGEARSRVALYLVLTMLPFSLLVPVAGPLLDRFPHGRRTVLALTTGGRGLLTWVMAGVVAGLALYPLALVVLVRSRAYGVARAAAVPRVRPPAVGLVSANARLNVAAVTAGAAVAAVGAGVGALFGSATVLRLASVVLILGGVLALRLPAHVDEPAAHNAVRDAGEGRFRLTRCARAVKATLAAAVALRALAGLLTIFLAFLLRADGAPTVRRRFWSSPSWRRRWVSSPGPGLRRACPRTARGCSRRSPSRCLFSPACWPHRPGRPPGSSPRPGATGAAVSLSKFALDAALQQHIAPRSLNTAFARSETGLQLAWVVGGGIALALPTTSAVGFAVAAALPVLGVVVARQLAVRAA